MQKMVWAELDNYFAWARRVGIIKDRRGEMTLVVADTDRWRLEDHWGPLGKDGADDQPEMIRQFLRKLATSTGLLPQTPAAMVNNAHTKVGAASVGAGSSSEEEGRGRRGRRGEGRSDGKALGCTRTAITPDTTNAPYPHRRSHPSKSYANPFLSSSNESTPPASSRSSSAASQLLAIPLPSRRHDHLQDLDLDLNPLPWPLSGAAAAAAAPKRRESKPINLSFPNTRNTAATKSGLLPPSPKKTPSPSSSAPSRSRQPAHLHPVKSAGTPVSSKQTFNQWQQCSPSSPASSGTGSSRVAARAHTTVSPQSQLGLLSWPGTPPSQQMLPTGGSHAATTTSWTLASLPPSQQTQQQQQQQQPLPYFASRPVDSSAPSSSAALPFSQAPPQQPQQAQQFFPNHPSATVAPTILHHADQWRDSLLRASRLASSSSKSTADDNIAQELVLAHALGNQLRDDLAGRGGGASAWY